MKPARPRTVLLFILLLVLLVAYGIRSRDPQTLGIALILFAAGLPDILRQLGRIVSRKKG